MTTWIFRLGQVMLGDGGWGRSAGALEPATPVCWLGLAAAYFQHQTDNISPRFFQSWSYRPSCSSFQLNKLDSYIKHTKYLSLGHCLIVSFCVLSLPGRGGTRS